MLTLPEPASNTSGGRRQRGNICTNQGLLALRARCVSFALGPQGLRETAELCVRKAHLCGRGVVQDPGVSLKFKTAFAKEFYTE